MGIHKLAIVGYGGMGLHHHEKLIFADNLTVKGAYDIDERRLKLAKEKGLVAFNSLDEVLNDKEIDIVLVATTNNYHKEISIKAMNAGKHVICEKPVAMNSIELLEMMACAKNNNVILTIHQNRRMDKDYLIVKEAIKSGKLGKVFAIQSCVQGARGVPFGWRTKKLPGGGMMLDWGVHLIDQILMLTEEKIVGVYCHMHSINTPEVDDTFKLLLRFEGGLSVEIDVDTSAFISLPRWYVTGSSGALRIDSWNCTGQFLVVKDTNVKWEEEIVYTKAGPTKTMAPLSENLLEELPIVEPENDYTKTFKNLVKAIEGKEELLVKPEEALRVMRVMEAAFLSNETGNAVLLES